MSFAITEPQMRARTKDVTRRAGWGFLRPGDLVQPVRKCMGLKAGEKVEKIGPPIRVKSVRREPLDMLTTEIDYGFAECVREGFPEPHECHWPSEFVRMFCASHRGCTPSSTITRIEFEYTE